MGGAGRAWRKGENNVLHCDREDGAKSFILTNQCTYDANIGWFERLYSHKYQEYDMFKNYIREELLHEDEVELLKDWFTELTPKRFCWVLYSCSYQRYLF